MVSEKLSNLEVMTKANVYWDGKVTRCTFFTADSEKVENVASRFKRSCEVEIEGIPQSFNLIFSKDACTGCHNTVISALMDMKAQDLFPYLENMNVCVGPCTEEMLPADANADNTVCIGICCKKLADAKGFRWVVGCPPGNADVVKGILGDRLEYGVRYN